MSAGCEATADNNLKLLEKYSTSKSHEKLNLRERYIYEEILEYFNSYVQASILASGELTCAMMPSAIAVEPLFLIVTVQLPLSKSDALSTSTPIC